MSPHIVFCHQSYPAQFGHISRFLMEQYGARISFFSEYLKQPPLPGLHHYSYKPVATRTSDDPYFFSRYFEQECGSMHAVYNAIKAAKLPDPDLFVGHAAFGTLGLLHVEYAGVPRIGYFELFYDHGAERGRSDPFPIPLPNRIRLPLRNATQLMELNYCTKGYSPTAFQRSTYPDCYQEKLGVLFDGIDVGRFSPGSPVGALKRQWPESAKVLTYVSRGLEAMRGFHLFMEVADRLCQRRTDLHFVVAGSAKTHYGWESAALQGRTFKEYVLGQRKYDLQRFHFLDWISEEALVDLFRITDCHFYWTVPFTLSWSLLQGLATGAPVVASNTAPVRDAIVDGVHGLLAEPDDIDGMVDRIEALLDRPGDYAHLRENARRRMVEEFSLEVCLPRLAQFLLHT